MGFSIFIPNDNGQERAKIKKIQKELEQKKQGRAMNLGNSEQHYKILEKSTEHVVYDLQHPVDSQTKKKDITVKEFNDNLFGL